MWKGIDVDVDDLPHVNISDVGFIDAGGDIDAVEVIGDSELGTGGDVGAIDAVVNSNSAIARSADGQLGLDESAEHLDTADELISMNGDAIVGGPVDQGAVGGSVDGDFVAINLGIISADVVAGVEEVAGTEAASGHQRQDQNNNKRDPVGTLELAPSRCRPGGAVGG